MSAISQAVAALVDMDDGMIVTMRQGLFASKCISALTGIPARSLVYQQDH
jgi:hypothetical protein